MKQNHLPPNHHNTDLFLIDQETNRVKPIMVKDFKYFNFSERDHLQEWIAHTPGVLGEELLIIQKEFDGFDETNERLDLLALDKSGQLVIIENKLDNSGRDVTWQALKYASYCTSLTKKQIVDIYQTYLDTTHPSEKLDAGEQICEFIEESDLDEVILNEGVQQRIILVAGSFRKEVTSTVLWLLRHGLNIQCIKATLYEYQNQALIHFDPIIPPKEAKDMMINMGTKDVEDTKTSAVKKGRELIRHEYWTQLLDFFEHEKYPSFKNISATKSDALGTGSGIMDCRFYLIFQKARLGVELYFRKRKASENKYLFDKLFQQKERIETSFGTVLKWQRLDKKKACRVSYSIDFNSFDEDNWADARKWHLEYIEKLDQAFRKPLEQVNKQLKSK